MRSILQSQVPRSLLRIVFDSKGLFDVDGNGRPNPLFDQHVIEGKNAARDLESYLKKHSTEHTILFKPPGWLIEDRAYANAILGIVYHYIDKRMKQRYKRRWDGAVVYVDEMSAIATATAIPSYWTALASRGRALRVAAWAGTQRPVMIPGTVLSESEIKLVFHLDTMKDRDKVAYLMGNQLFKESPQELAEQAGAREGDPAWFSFFLKQHRNIGLFHIGREG